MDPDARTRELANRAIAAGDPTAWFEELYEAASRGDAVVPWDRDEPHSLLASWPAPAGDGRRALVVGAGLGRDAEHLAGLGYSVVAFDISPTAVEAARRRHPGSPVRYVTADLLSPPESWSGAFDLVVESMTVQALPDPPRAAAIAQVGRFVAPGGTLLVIAAGRDPDMEFDGPPWPLTRDEVSTFAVGDLVTTRVEELRDRDPIFGWRAEFTRPPSH